VAEKETRATEPFRTFQLRGSGWPANEEKQMSEIPSADARQLRFMSDVELCVKRVSNGNHE
jgi:hypothetical protein